MKPRVPPPDAIPCNQRLVVMGNSCGGPLQPARGWRLAGDGARPRASRHGPGAERL